MNNSAISIIVAISNNYAIGNGGKMPWHISEDLKYFKKVTLGSTVIMGRKTWESIGKALPGRENIVISRSLDKLEGATVFNSIEMALDHSKKSNNPIFIIGGGEIYKATIGLASRLYITEVHVQVDEADTFFPEIDLSKWVETDRVKFPRGENYRGSFDFVIYDRVSS